MSHEALNLSSASEAESKQLLKKADIFSLGASLFEIIEQTRLESNGQ